MRNSYLTLEPDPATGRFHPLLAGFEDATRIINGVNRVLATPMGASGASPLTVVPSYPDLPMEEVFPRPGGAKEAGVFVRETGRGRVVYFPWDIDRTYWEVLDVDHGKLVRNAVLWATNEPAPVLVASKGVLDVSVWTQEESMTVHLVNLTNPMMMKGPVREVIPLTQVNVSVRVPQGRGISRARLLVGERELSRRLVDDFVQVEVPEIGVHEVVAFDFG
jgi:hypothetical protein